MTKKPAALPIFGDAYLADTVHLTTEQHGAYFLLMLAAWRRDGCKLPDDERLLARIAGMSLRKWRSNAPALMEFWELEDGFFVQKRLLKEYTYVVKKSRTNASAAKARWDSQETENKGSGKCERNANAMPGEYERNAPPPPPSTTLPSGNVDDDDNSDPVKIVFEQGHEVLEAAGHTEHARRGRVIGNWRKQCGDDDRLIAILSSAASMPPRDPISWVNAAIHRREEDRVRQPQPPRDTRDGFTRAIDDDLARARDARRAAEAIEQ